MMICNKCMAKRVLAKEAEPHYEYFHRLRTRASGSREVSYRKSRCDECYHLTLVVERKDLQP